MLPIIVTLKLYLEEVNKHQHLRLTRMLNAIELTWLLFKAKQNLAAESPEIFEGEERLNIVQTCNGWKILSISIS